MWPQIAMGRLRTSIVSNRSGDKYNGLRKLSSAAAQRKVAKEWSHAKLQQEHEQKKAVGDIEEIEFVPRAGIGDGLRLLRGGKRVALHLLRIAMALWVSPARTAWAAIAAPA